MKKSYVNISMKIHKTFSSILVLGIAQRNYYRRLVVNNFIARVPGGASNQASDNSYLSGYVSFDVVEIDDGRERRIVFENLPLVTCAMAYRISSSSLERETP